jgi:hypothetical protein
LRTADSGWQGVLELGRRALQNFVALGGQLGHVILEIKQIRDLGRTLRHSLCETARQACFLRFALLAVAPDEPDLIDQAIHQLSIAQAA